MNLWTNCPPLVDAAIADKRKMPIKGHVATQTVSPSLSSARCSARPCTLLGFPARLNNFRPGRLLERTYESVGFPPRKNDSLTRKWCTTEPTRALVAAAGNIQSSSLLIPVPFDVESTERLRKLRYISSLLKFGGAFSRQTGRFP
jgi:hypothetical protein